MEKLGGFYTPSANLALGTIHLALNEENHVLIFKAFKAGTYKIKYKYGSYDMIYCLGSREIALVCRVFRIYVINTLQKNICQRKVMFFIFENTGNDS